MSIPVVQHQTATSEQALRLSEMWSRVSRRHVAAGAGCSCGIGGLFLQASDFELDIVEFLINDAREQGRGDLEPFINAVALRGSDRYSLSGLLDSIGRPEHAAMLSNESLQFTLERLERTLSSIDTAHSRDRFSCD